MKVREKQPKEMREKEIPLGTKADAESPLSMVSLKQSTWIKFDEMKHFFSNLQHFFTLYFIQVQTRYSEGILRHSCIHKYEMWLIIEHSHHVVENVFCNMIWQFQQPCIHCMLFHFSKSLRVLVPA